MDCGRPVSDIADSSQGFAFGEALYPLGGVYGPLTGRYLCILLVHEGQVTITSDDSRAMLDEGQCGIFYSEHSYLAEFEIRRRVRVSWCEATPGNLPEAVAMRVRGGSAGIDISERLDTLIRIGVDLGSAFGANINAFRNALGEAVFHAFFHDARMWEQALQMPRPVQTAKQHIDDNFADDLTVAGLASKAGVTPQHLISLFGKHLGVTPIRYLWQKRADRSQFLLLNTGLTIAEIAYQCGYKNPFHFSRQIKQRYGVSPKEIRARGGYRTPAELRELSKFTGRISGLTVKGRSELHGQVQGPKGSDGAQRRKDK